MLTRTFRAQSSTLVAQSADILYQFK